MNVPPVHQLEALRAVYGSRIPKDVGGAARMLEQSPAAPTGQAEKAALLDVAKALAGQELPRLDASAEALKKLPLTVGLGPRPLPQGLGLQMMQMQGVDALPGQQGLDKVLSPARAQALFDQIAADPTIPHKFIDEGCHFRSTLSAKILEDEGVFSEKIVISPDRADLKIHSEHSPVGFTLAMFHMATAVWVDEGKGPERRVIDPSLGEGPMTIDAWASRMEGLNGKPCDIYFLPRFVGHPMDRDAPPSAWSDKELEAARSWSRDYKEVEQSMLDSGFHQELIKMEKDFRAQHAQEAAAAGGASTHAAAGDTPAGDDVVVEDEG